MINNVGLDRRKKQPIKELENYFDDMDEYFEINKNKCKYKYKLDDDD